MQKNRHLTVRIKVGRPELAPVFRTIQLRLFELPAEKGGVVTYFKDDIAWRSTKHENE